MTDPVIKTIEVESSAEHAFQVFVEKTANWWPLDKNSVSAMGGAVARSVTIEPRLGGRVYEIGHDDTIHEWGTVTAYEPGKRLRMDWHIGLSAEQASDVEVLFTQLSASRTKVQLTHQRWEAFGKKAANMRAGYDQGWVGVFEQAYAKACATSTATA